MEKLETSLVTGEFRVSFPNVFSPAKTPNGEEKYNIVMLFKSDSDLSALKTAIKNAVINKWPDATKRPKIKMPIRDGSEKDFDGYSGCVFISASSKEKPVLVDENLKPILDRSRFYAGCYARAEINAFAYDNAGNRGVSFGLWKIQKLRDGEKFGGGKPVEQVFTAVRPSAPNMDDDGFMQAIEDEGLIVKEQSKEVPF